MEFISSHLKQKFEEESQKPESKLLRLVLREYDRLTSFLEDLEKYEEEGELIKKEFSDLGSSFSRLVDTAYDNYVGLRSMINTPYEEQTKIENDLIWEKPSNAAGLNKFMRLLKKMNIENESNEVKEAHEYAVNVTQDLIECRERIQAFKKEDKIVKKKKAVVQKEEEKAKKASHKDVLKTKEHLEEIIETLHDKLVQRYKSGIMNHYERIQTALIKDDLKIDKKIYGRNEKPETMQKRFTYSEINDVAETNGNFYILKDKKVLEEKADKLAEQMYQDLKEFYTTRVGSKVAFVLNHKNNLDNIETHNIEVTSQVESYLKFNFKDNSSFELSTKVEWSTLPSDYTKMFMRVPTRFHNAITPDGVKHTDLSEKIVQDLYTREYPDKDVQNILKNKQSELNKANKIKPK